MSSRTILRRTIHTTSRLRSQKPYEKSGQEVGSSTTSGAKTYVVSQPLENEKPYGVPSGVYSSGEKHKADASDVSSSLPPSSSSASPAHPTTTKQALSGDLADRNAGPSEEQGKLGRDKASANRK
ncbi:hypothetical protein BDV93DRAFT_544923 [Ceratobasidium sp. AG-I]|nr:hypothetical protein BDV93DRAFT_544923 [Ceratobasidium sp. AG-I]